MSVPRMSTGIDRALDVARDEARRLGQEAVGVEHVILALHKESPEAGALFRRLSLDDTQIVDRLQASARRSRARAESGAHSLTSNARRLVESAGRAAAKQGTELMPEHLLSAALDDPKGVLVKVLGEGGVSAEQARHAADQMLRTETANPPTSPPRWRYVLLAAVPLSIVLGYVMKAPPLWVFVTACLGVLPLASYMGEATEHLSARTGPTIGGLLNATFGNAAELIIAVVALKAGLVDLVKASITGSILGNLLLILGLSIVAGGLTRSELKFNRTTAGMSAGMMALAVVAMVFPALYHATHPSAGRGLVELRMSEGVSVILLATYGLSLLFTLRTHRRLFGGDAHPVDGPTWSVKRAILVLALATVGVAVESELLVHAAEAATEAVGLSPVFLGLIIIPIIGNAAEHAAAVMLSRKGQIDLGLQIALGSSAQVALLIAPVLVFVGLALGVNMNLVFSPFEVMALGLATVVTAIITLDGESHWFEGVQLLAVYAMVAIGAFFL